MSERDSMAISGGRRRFAALTLILLILAAALLLAVSPRAAVAQTPSVEMEISHTGSTGLGANYLINSSSGTVSISVINNNSAAIPASSINISLPMPSLTYSTPLTSSPDNIFTCTGFPNGVTCSNTGGALPIGGLETITFTVIAGPTPSGPHQLQGVLFVVGEPGFENAADAVLYSVVGPATQTFTPSPTRTITPTRTVIPTFTAFPTITPLPSATTIPTATFIPNPPTRTPPPRPANAGQAIGPVPRAGVTVVVDRDGVNVRITPALGAEPIAFVNAG
jgi:hypothetical protein